MQVYKAGLLLHQTFLEEVTNFQIARPHGIGAGAVQTSKRYYE